LESVSTPPNEKSSFKKFMPGGDKPMAPEARRRLITIAIVAFVLGLLIIPSLFSNKTVKTISYS
jgi:hypothetical protein